MELKFIWIEEYKTLRNREFNLALVLMNFQFVVMK
jgi:hypothetical protein